MAILLWFHNFSQRASQKNHQLIKTTMSDRYVEFHVYNMKLSPKLKIDIESLFWLFLTVKKKSTHFLLLV